MVSDGPDRSADAGPSLDDVARVMRDRHRRLALYYLLRHDRASIAELVDVVAGWTRTAEGAAATPADRERVSRAMRVIHLPEMEDAKVVRLHPECDAVSLADLPPRYRSFLEWTAAVETRFAHR